jgi:hypothetical protein
MATRPPESPRAAGLAPHHVARAERVRTLARLLDSAVRVPGTNLRFGLDAVVGLIPGVGDVIGAAASGYIVLAAARLGAPAPVLLRMLLNSGIDVAVGTVPLIGDLFDVGWRSNARNVALLERHLSDPRGARAASRRVVLLVLIGLAVLAVAALVLAFLAVRALLRAAT